ncbi:MAG: histidinol dehydrogenase [Bacillota bacterium]|nr:histidinol dehydrogenase [Bacillota bacterium]
MIKIKSVNEINFKQGLTETIDENLTKTVAGIIADVRANGDKALRAYTAKFDGVHVDDFEVSDAEMDAAIKSVDGEFISVLKTAAENIRKFHEKQKRDDLIVFEQDGKILGQKFTPIERVGLYVPGGTAVYPSTVLMTVIPARIAGCENITMVSPPDKASRISPLILAAAQIAGVSKVCKAGGAQAIAALAYGTESIENVYKIVGPGNRYVAEAKRQVSGVAGIDMVAGPSEILIIAEQGADPDFIAADLLSQAEHDAYARSILLTTDRELAKQVQEKVEVQLPNLLREEIARRSIEEQGLIVICDSKQQMFDLSNQIAPEHLELMTANPLSDLSLVKNAGSVFLGAYTPEPTGDYFSGTNHTLPTSGTAKFANPLSVDDFVKKTQFSFYTREALKKDAEAIIYFAEKEGLTAHANSVRERIK